MGVDCILVSYHQAELLSEIVSEAFPKTAPPSFFPCEFTSADSPPVKKTKKREAPKDKDKDKDPNAPKKPANAFFMYCQQQRTVMQDDQKDPNIGHHELTKSLAKEWNNLATDDKKVCVISMLILHWGQNHLVPPVSRHLLDQNNVFSVCFAGEVPTYGWLKMRDFPASRVSFPVVLGWEGLGPQLNLCPLMGRAHYLEVQLYLNLITRRVCWEWAIYLCDYCAT